MRKSRLPEGGENLFQGIKAVAAKAQEGGAKLIKLSIGQPSGPALESARKAAAEAVLSTAETMHAYQDNDCPGVPGFAERFVRAHVSRQLFGGSFAFLPIPGIKPMLEVIPLACGDGGVVVTCTNPGYPTPKIQCDYLGKEVWEPELLPGDEFLLNTSALETYQRGKNVNLIMTNYPHNPSGAVANPNWWESLCDFCQKYDVRLFNDAAYAALSFGPDSWCLSDIAPDFSKLSWCEAFSASKLIGNGTGWRVGAMVGSPDFMDDIRTIKGNTDSGLVAPMAAGALYALEEDQASIVAVRGTYQQRCVQLCSILRSAGMQLACEPRAGFFTLWKTPTMAFGERIRDAKQFNFLMIEKTGVVGVHFNPYIRYSVASVDIAEAAVAIGSAFAQAKVSYS